MLDIIGEVWFGTVESEYIVLHEHNFEQDIFDLSTKKLGDILQKFTIIILNWQLLVILINTPVKYSKILFMRAINIENIYLCIQWTKL